MPCPKSNWFFKLKGLTFLIIGAGIILTEFNLIHEFDLPYIAAALFIIWGLTFLSYSPEEKITQKQMVMESVEKISSTSKKSPAKKSTSPKNASKAKKTSTKRK